ncbi:uncharacterized protein MONBRDRAFT_27030 [Monosiga brevicollis MX1]|uniref:Sulfatase N-terminal domain-containing protein n=1 Tax=Monosiga brevicollis TaxID=81824 RepID=A9V439_MONBE|nr:uncharacterized protein MONBRDRAFT_27030 [Monosiga brevicollis MX1]EDQ87638.1 predicted protein [Monosiga brevicollis MX1]|eukprot:XP_001747558.1 hypothetical protein [Monosiga brevicollis MX1]
MGNPIRGGSLLIVAASLLVCATLGTAKQPNILFVIDESTDAKAYFAKNPEKAPMPLPNLRVPAHVMNSYHYHVRRQSAFFLPDASPCMLSQPNFDLIHHIPHQQTNPSTGLFVTGAWNNYEGLPENYDLKYSDVLHKGGYNVGIFGKTDFTAGGHTVDARVTAWTNKVNFPFTLQNGSAGWYDETGPLVRTVNVSKVVHVSDWNHANQTAKFIADAATHDEPWLAYVGFDIVHPDYVSSPYWLDQVDMDKVTVPEWIPLDQLHPEDFQATMKKNMANLTHDPAFIKSVRQHYYGMIAEYDAILGVVLDAVEASGEADNTYIFVTSDHGDMNMEHQQYYKMTYYDPSARVPLIVTGPTVQANVTYENLTSHLDFFPTFLELANVRKDDYKYVTFGSGKEVAPRLFNMREDPLEMNDLAPSNPSLVAELDAELRSYWDYPSIASTAESYNKDSFALLRASFNDEDKFKAYLATLRWSTSWSYDPEGSYAAIEAWLKTPNSTFEWAFP